MLRGTPTKYGSGIQIWGDPLDLHHAYSLIHEISKQAEKRFPKEVVNLFFLSLAYDIRKAKEEAEDKIIFSTKEYLTPYDLKYLGVKVLWPIFILGVNFLRQAVGYTENRKGFQALISTLEDICIYCLEDYDEETANYIVPFVEDVKLPPNIKNMELLLAHTNYELISGPNGKKRFNKLPGLLRSFLAHSPERDTVISKYQQQAEDLGIDFKEVKFNYSLFEQHDWKW